MPPLTKDALLGASDIVEREIDLPSIGGSVKVRSLPAAYANQAMSEALEVTTGRRGEQSAKVNTEKLEALQVLHGLVEPKLDTLEEVRTFALHCGPAWRKVVEAIDELSGLDKDAVDKANALFRSGGPGEGGSDLGNGTSPGHDRPDLSVRAGA